MISSIGRKELDKALKRNNWSSADTLLDYLQTSNDFPDNELAENVEKARNEFRKNFKLQSSS